MRVRLIREAKVNLPAGFEVDVNDTEAARLLAFGYAEKAEAKAEAAEFVKEQAAEEPKKKAKK